MRTKVHLLVLLLVCPALAGCREEILHGLEEREANRIRVVLSEAGIEAEKVRDGAQWSIGVPKLSADAALAALERRRALPAEESKESQAPGGFLHSREERRHYLERRLSLSLEKTLEQMPGVLEARVHINMQEPSLLSARKEGEASSAGVLLVAEKDDLDIEKAEKLISGAAGIPLEAVSVVVVAASPAPALSEPTPEAPAPPSAEPSSISFEGLLNRKPSVPMLSFLLGGLGLVSITLFARRVRVDQGALRRSDGAA